MPTPDLDQTLSLQAKMQDSISPTLKKIEQGLKSTSDALRELEAAVNAAATKVGVASESMADKSSRATERLQQSVQQTGQSFQQLGSAAQQGAEQVGSALRDTLYTKGSAERLNELDKDLGHLKDTFMGIASTNRGASAKARKMQAIGQDTLNKRVIPAFQELHGVLDDYPDTLKEIAGLEKSRMTGLGGALEGVSKRVSGFGDRIKAIGFGIEDFVAGVTTGVTGARGMTLRRSQKSAGQIAGLGAFADTAEAIPDIQMATQAMEDVWGGAYETLLDIGKESRRSFPYILKEVTDLSKVTGLSSDYFAELKVQIQEIANVDGGAWIDLSQKISTFATESRASIEDLSAVLSDAAGKMVRFGRDSRAAYANAQLAAGAAGADIGIGAQTTGEMMEGLMNDPGFLAKMQGLAGTDILNKLGDPSKHMEMLAQIYGGAGKFIQDRGLEMWNPVDRQAFESIAGGPGMNSDVAAMVSNFMQENGMQTQEQFTKFFVEMQKNVGEQTDEFKKLASAIRGTAPEQLERMKAIMDAPVADIGNQTVNALEAGLEPAIAMTASIVGSMRRMDKESEHFWSKGIAFFSIGVNAMNALGGVLKFIPGLGGLAKALSTPLATFGGAALIAKAVDKKVTAKEAALTMTPEDMRQADKEQLDKVFAEDSGTKFVDPSSNYFIPYAEREKIKDVALKEQTLAARDKEVQNYDQRMNDYIMGRGAHPGERPKWVQGPRPEDPGSAFFNKDFALYKEKMNEQGITSGNTIKVLWDQQRAEKLRQREEWDNSHINRPANVTGKEVQEAWDRAIEERRRQVDVGDRGKVTLSPRERQQIKEDLWEKRKNAQRIYDNTGIIAMEGGQPDPARGEDGRIQVKQLEQARGPDWTREDEYRRQNAGLYFEDRKKFDEGLKNIKNPDAIFTPPIQGTGGKGAAIEVPTFDDGVLNTGGPMDLSEAQLKVAQEQAEKQDQANSYLKKIAEKLPERDRFGRVIVPKEKDDKRTELDNASGGTN